MEEPQEFGGSLKQVEQTSENEAERAIPDENVGQLGDHSSPNTTDENQNPEPLKDQDYGTILSIYRINDKVMNVESDNPEVEYARDVNSDLLYPINEPLEQRESRRTSGNKSYDQTLENFEKTDEIDEDEQIESIADIQPHSGEMNANENINLQVANEEYSLMRHTGGDHQEKLVTFNEPGGSNSFFDIDKLENDAHLASIRDVDNFDDGYRNFLGEQNGQHFDLLNYNPNNVFFNDQTNHIAFNDEQPVLNREEQLPDEKIEEVTEQNNTPKSPFGDGISQQSNDAVQFEKDSPGKRSSQNDFEDFYPTENKPDVFQLRIWSQKIPKLVLCIETIMKQKLGMIFQMMQANADAANLDVLKLAEFQEESLRNLSSIKDISIDQTVEQSVDNFSEAYFSAKNISNQFVNKKSVNRPSKSTSGYNNDREFLNNYMSITNDQNTKKIQEVLNLGKKDVIQEMFVQDLANEDKSASEELKDFEESGYAGSNFSEKEIQIEPMKKVQNEARKRTSMQVGVTTSLFSTISLAKPTKSSKKFELLKSINIEKTAKANPMLTSVYHPTFKEERNDRFESFDHNLANSGLERDKNDNLDGDVEDILKRNSIAQIMQNSHLRTKLDEHLREGTNRQLLESNVASYNNLAVQDRRAKVKFNSKVRDDDILEEEDEEEDVRSGFRIMRIGNEVIDSGEEGSIRNNREEDMNISNFNSAMMDSMNAHGHGSFRNSADSYTKPFADDEPKNSLNVDNPFLNQMKLIQRNETYHEKETNANVLQNNLKALQGPGKSAIKKSDNPFSFETRLNLDIANGRSNFKKSSKELAKPPLGDLTVDGREELAMAKLKERPQSRMMIDVNIQGDDLQHSLDGSIHNENFDSPDKIQENHLMQTYIQNNMQKYLDRQSNQEGSEVLEENLSEEAEFIDSLNNYKSDKFLEKQENKIRSETFGNGVFQYQVVQSSEFQNAPNSNRNSDFQTGSLSSNRLSNLRVLNQRNSNQFSGHGSNQNSFVGFINNLSSKRLEEGSGLWQYDQQWPTAGDECEDELFTQNLNKKSTKRDLIMEQFGEHRIDLGPYGSFVIPSKGATITIQNLQPPSIQQSLRSIIGYKSNQYDSLITKLAHEQFEPKLKGTIVIDLLINVYCRKTLKIAFLALKVEKLIQTDPRSTFLNSTFNRLLSSFKLSSFISIFNFGIERQKACLIIQKIAASLLKNHVFATVKSLEAPPAVMPTPVYDAFSYPLKSLSRIMSHITKEKLFDSFAILSLLRFQGEAGLALFNTRAKDNSTVPIPSLYNTKNQSNDLHMSKVSNPQYNFNKFASNVGDNENDNYQPKGPNLKGKVSKPKPPAFPLLPNDSKQGNYFKFRNNVNNPIQAMKAEKMSVSSHHSGYKSHNKMKSSEANKSSKRHSVQLIGMEGLGSKKGSFANAPLEPFDLQHSQLNGTNTMHDGQLSNFFMNSELHVNRINEHSSLRTTPVSPPKPIVTSSNPLTNIIDLTKEIQVQMQALYAENNSNIQNVGEKSQELALRLEEIQHKLHIMGQGENNLSKNKSSEIIKLEKSISDMVTKINNKSTAGDKDKEPDSSLTARRYQNFNSHSANSESNIKDNYVRSLSNQSVREQSNSKFSNPNGPLVEKENKLEEIVKALELLSKTIEFKSQGEIPFEFKPGQNDRKISREIKESFDSKGNKQTPSIPIEESQSKNLVGQTNEKNLVDFALVLNFALIRKLKVSKRIAIEQLKTNLNSQDENLKKVKIFFIDLVKHSFKQILIQCAQQKARKDEKVAEIVIELSKRYRIIAKKALNLLRAGRLALNSAWSIRGLSVDGQQRTEKNITTHSFRKSNEIVEGRIGINASEKVSLISKATSGGKEPDDVFFKSLENEYMQIISKTPDQSMIAIPSPDGR